MNTARKMSLLVLLVAITIIAASAAPLLGLLNSAPDKTDAVEFGPNCCRYDNECPGKETCGDTTGCSAGAPYTCSGGTEVEIFD